MSCVPITSPHMMKTWNYHLNLMKISLRQYFLIVDKTNYTFYVKRYWYFNESVQKQLLDISQLANNKTAFWHLKREHMNQRLESDKMILYWNSYDKFVKTKKILRTQLFKLQLKCIINCPIVHKWWKLGITIWTWWKFPSGNIFWLWTNQGMSVLLGPASKREAQLKQIYGKK